MTGAEETSIDRMQELAETEEWYAKRRYEDRLDRMVAALAIAEGPFNYPNDQGDIKIVNRAEDLLEAIDGKVQWDELTGMR